MRLLVKQRNCNSAPSKLENKNDREINQIYIYYIYVTNKKLQNSRSEGSLQKGKIGTHPITGTLRAAMIAHSAQSIGQFLNRNTRKRSCYCIIQECKLHRPKENSKNKKQPPSKGEISIFLQNRHLSLCLFLKEKVWLDKKSTWKLQMTWMCSTL